MGFCESQVIKSSLNILFSDFWQKKLGTVILTGWVKNKVLHFARPASLVWRPPTANATTQAEKAQIEHQNMAHATVTGCAQRMRSQQTVDNWRVREYFYIDTL